MTFDNASLEKIRDILNDPENRGDSNQTNKSHAIVCLKQIIHDSKILACAGESRRHVFTLLFNIGRLCEIFEGVGSDDKWQDAFGELFEKEDYNGIYLLAAKYAFLFDLDINARVLMPSAPPGNYNC